MLLDINMPEMDGLECCKQVTEQYPYTKVLALPKMRELGLAKAMLKHGISGFLLKLSSTNTAGLVKPALEYDLIN